MLEFFVTGLLLCGTAMQAYAALRETARTHRAAIDESVAEDDLRSEVPWWRFVARQALGRDLRGMRSAEMHRDIQHVNLVFGGWLVLMAGSALALGGALFT